MKKILTLLLTLFILVGCSTIKHPIVDEKYNGATYVEQLKNFKPGKKNINNTIDNEEFDRFLDEVFIENIDDDFLFMHYSVVDYKKYGIEKPEVNCGEIKYEIDEEEFEEILNNNERLKEFDYNTLSYRQQYDYDALYYSNLETLASLCFYKYSLVFSMDNNMPELIIQNLQDYTFYDLESLEDYMTCLKDVSRFNDDLVSYTIAQGKDHIYNLDDGLNYTTEFCYNFVSKEEDNVLITSFEKRLDDVDFILDSQKDEYINENKKIVIDSVIPSYEKLINDIGVFYGKTDLNNNALYKLDKDYAEFVYYLSGSNNYDIGDTMNLLKDTLATIENEEMSVEYNQDLFDMYTSALYGGVDIFYDDSNSILDTIKEKMNNYYPEIGDISYTVKSLDPSAAPDTAVAYYFPSPIDNYNQNIICTNPNNMDEGVSTFNTLAHEGIPGHLYQHVYYLKTNPHNFRSVIGFIGYTEGYALEATKDAFSICTVDNSIVADALFIDSNDYFIVYSIIDIGVNYYGWKAKDIVKFFNNNSNYYSFTLESAEEMRKFLINMPGTYCQYGIGFAYFENLRHNAQNELDEKFNLVEYNESILKNGPLPFNILEGAINEYISK